MLLCCSIVVEFELTTHWDNHLLYKNIQDATVCLKYSAWISVDRLVCGLPFQPVE